VPFPATVFNVLIASPSDVPSEREAIASCLHAWNALNSKESGKVLLPVMWESHSAPSMADRAQAVINDQVVRSCDMLIGAFWTRLGSPTGKEDSGTVEEIKWFLKQKKPVMLYFSKAHVDPDALDTSQFEALKAFKKDLTSKGLLEQYSSIDDLSQKLMRQITIVMREMNVGPIVDSRAVKRASVAAESGSAANTIALPKLDDVYLEYYTAKSFITRGNTKDKKDALKAVGGSWISPRTGGKTWCFSNKRLDEVAAILDIPATLQPSKD
jgi:nucleoside 2-deoxyribosyltransferase